MVPILVTIDTEGHKGKDPVDKLILGKTAIGSYGIERIMSEFEKVGARILFFLDFAEVWDYGEEKIRDVAEKILSRGHDIGVHLHPDHMGDPDRIFLYEYSYDEQYDMIKKCTEMYKKIVGKYPKSFRAGKYAANYDTLDILDQLGYKYDFSEFYHQTWCGIDPPLTINAPCKYKNVTEIPVTMHKSVHLGGILYREDKFDVEGMTYKELLYALSQIKRSGIHNVTTLFFHSFSLLDWRSNPDDPHPDVKKIKRLSKIIEYINSSDEYCFITENDLDDVVEIQSSTNLMQSEIVWKSNIRGIYFTYLKAVKIAKENKKAKFLVITVNAAMVILLAILFLIIWMVFL